MNNVFDELVFLEFRRAFLNELFGTYDIDRRLTNAFFGPNGIQIIYKDE